MESMLGPLMTLLVVLHSAQAVLLIVRRGACDEVVMHVGGLCRSWS